MSYDYNAYLSKIADLQQQLANSSQENDNESVTVLTQLLNQYEELSGHCPMTPILWMNYAKYTGKLLWLSSNATNDTTMELQLSIKQTQCDLIELALQEFPGSALLQLEACCLAIQRFHLQQQEQQTPDHTTDAASSLHLSHLQAVLDRFDTTLQAVACGSHVHEDVCVVLVYQLYTTFLQEQLHVRTKNGDSKNYQTITSKVLQNKLQTVWLQRAWTPMLSMNDGLWQEILEQHSATSLLNRDDLEDARKALSRIFSSLSCHEDTIDSALHQQGTVLMAARTQIHTRLLEHAETRLKLAKQNAPGDTDPVELPVLDIITPNESKNDTNNEGGSGDFSVSDNNQATTWYGMGLGGAGVADAYIHYARAVQQQYNKAVGRHLQDAKERKEDETEDEDINDDSGKEVKVLSNLIVPIYERGVAECPTISSLWLAYARFLTYVITSYLSAPDKDQRERLLVATQATTRLPSVLIRATRNCPNSLELAQCRLRTQLVLYRANVALCDPEVLLQTAQSLLDTKFLPGPVCAYDLYQLAIQVVQQRMLMLLASEAPAVVISETGNKKKAPKDSAPQSRKLDYDEEEPPIPDNKKKATEEQADDVDLSEKTLQELEDLVDDLPDMFDEVEKRLKKNFSTWSEGRSLLLKARYSAQLWILGPLRKVWSEEETSVNDSTDKDQELRLELADKAVRAHNPSHPDTWLAYIREWLSSTSWVQSEVGALRRLRQTRYLYRKAVHSIGKTKQQSSTSWPRRDFDAAFSDLCFEWMEFEHLFGSDRSIGAASKAIAKKKEKYPMLTQYIQTTGSHVANGTNVTTDPKSTKRKIEEPSCESENERPSKKAKPESTDATEKEECTTADEKKKDSSQVVHKVKVGNLDYPAHPFTVRVMKLNPKTEDMDLVDTFRQCGPIVHARVVRAKAQQGHRVGNSKGWGLVQFEDRESVEKALALNDVIGLHEKLIQIERSHLPAVSLVPPGMHRVNEKGQGKYSKRNQKKRETVEDVHEDAKPEKQEDKEVKEPDKDTKKESMSVLAFRPRGVSARGGHQKARLALNTGKPAKK